MMMPAACDLTRAVIAAVAALPVMFAIAGAVSCTASSDVEPGQDSLANARSSMVTDQIAKRGVADPRVLAAMRDVPRHLFVPAEARTNAYDDTPLSIGHQQTISQPYIVALMTELVRPGAGDRALEIGTGSGYQAAVLSRVVATVYTIEIVETLAREAEQRLKDLDYANVIVRHGDGYAGWPEHAPFDIIVVTAAPDHVPQPLVDQLKPGGRMVIPVGSVYEGQDLRLIEKDRVGQIRTRTVTPVRFVPLRRGRG
jgi:protein-L-isoaspartate(D-aspartate) O-methyltransferase